MNGETNMIVRVKSFNGTLPDNITLNKDYAASRVDADRMRVTLDDGQIVTSCISKSGYLGDFGEWQIVSESA